MEPVNCIIKRSKRLSTGITLDCLTTREGYETVTESGVLLAISQEGEGGCVWPVAVVRTSGGDLLSLNFKCITIL